MMELVRGWLLGITGAAILAAVADGLMPEGGVRQVGKLVCGLVLLFAVLAPLSGGRCSPSASARYRSENTQSRLLPFCSKSCAAVEFERSSASSRCSGRTASARSPAASPAAADRMDLAAADNPCGSGISGVPRSKSRRTASASQPCRRKIHAASEF